MKIAIFIDGGNLYSKLKNLGIKRTSRFDFKTFLKSLTGDVSPSFIGYYVGQIRKEKGNAKSETLYANQQKLFAHLQVNTPGINIIRGHIQNCNGIKECRARRLLREQDVKLFEAKDLSK